MGFRSKTECNTVPCLVPQVDPGSFWSYIGECDITLTNGATCHQPAVGFFTANGGLRKIEVCQLHTSEFIIRILQAYEDTGGDCHGLLERVGEQNFLYILLNELENDGTSLLGPDNEIRLDGQ